MKEEFDKFFRYPIGGSIVGLAQFESLKADIAINGAPERLATPYGETIIERRLQQCHGGIQGFYIARRVDGEGRECLVAYTEIEVVSLAEVQTALADVMKAGRLLRTEWLTRDRRALDSLKQTVEELRKGVAPPETKEP